MKKVLVFLLLLGSVVSGFAQSGSPIVVDLKLIEEILKESIVGKFGTPSIDMPDFQNKSMEEIMKSLSNAAANGLDESNAIGMLYGDLTAYRKIEQAQQSQIESQMIIEDKLKKIAALELKMQNYRSNLQKVMQKANSKDYLNMLVRDISKTQASINKAADEFPAYKELAKETDRVLNKRAKRIMKYMDNCGQKTGLKAQLDNKERTEMTLFVASELETMRSIAFRTLMIMKAGMKIKAVNKANKTQKQNKQ